MKYHITAPLIVGLILVLSACGGLDPANVPPPAAMKGTVTFIGGSEAWPDSAVEQVLVVAFEEEPSSPEEVIAAVLGNTAVFSDTITRYIASEAYEMEIPGAPRTFKYVVVGMQNGPSLLTDWLMLDVYSTTGDPSMPSTVQFGVGDTLQIDFNVDFSNLPPQPFE